MTLCRPTVTRFGHPGHAPRQHRPCRPRGRSAPRSRSFSRSQNTVSFSTFSASTMRIEIVRYCNFAMLAPASFFCPVAYAASAFMRRDMGVPMLSPTRAAEAFSISRARCAYRAVVPMVEWPSSCPIMLRLSPSAKAREAYECLRSWIRTSFSPACVRIRSQ